MEPRSGAAAGGLRQRAAVALRTLLLAWLALALPGELCAQALEHEVKAAYVYRFLSYVEWPGNAAPPSGAPLAIGVLGADDVAAQLEEIVPGRRVQGRPISVRRVREGEPLAGLQVLYVGRAAAAMLPRLAGAPGLLVVSDAPDALEHGATIALVQSEGRVRFRVALDDAERRGLRISSRMLAVAESVRGAKP